MLSLTPYRAGADSGPHFFPPQGQTERGGGDSPAARRFLSASSRSLAIDSTVETSGAIEITTAEGDRVSISQSAREALSYASYDASGRWQGDGEAGRYRLHTEQQTYSEEHNFAMTVEGDLSEQEQREIRLVLDSMDGMMTDFLSGNLAGVAEHASEIGGLETIASAEANLSYSRSVSVELSEQAQQVIEEGGAPPSEMPDRTVRSEHGHGHRRGHHAGRRDRERLVDRMIRELEKNSDNPARLARKLPRMIELLGRKVAKRYEDHPGKREIADRTFTRLIDRLERMAERVETERPERPAATGDLSAPAHGFESREEAAETPAP